MKIKLLLLKYHVWWLGGLTPVQSEILCVQLLDLWDRTVLNINNTLALNYIHLLWGIYSDIISVLPDFKRYNDRKSLQDKMTAQYW